MSFNPGGGGGIAGASDVALNNPATDDVLEYNNSVGKWQNGTLSGKVSLANGGGKETVSFMGALSGAQTIDLSVANIFSLSLAGAVTLTLTGATVNVACSFTLYVYGGSTNTITWPGSVKWPNGTAPTLTGTSSAPDILVFESLNGGSVWHGNLVGNSYQ